MNLLSVNEALDELDALAGKDIQIHGILSFEFEDVAIYHSPTSERRGNYGSSIWISVVAGSLGFNEKACKALHGKNVVITGTLVKPDPSFGGGHMGLWPAEFIARTLERHEC